MVTLIHRFSITILFFVLLTVVWGCASSDGDSGTTTNPPKANNAGLQVSSLSVVGGIAKTAPNSSVSVVFTDSINPATVDSSSAFLSIGGSPLPPSSVAITTKGSTITINPTASLTGGSKVTVSATTGIKDIFGDSLDSDVVVEYIVGALDDVEEPEVSFTIPANGDVDVAVDAVIIAEFSEPVDPATVNTTTFILEKSGMPGTLVSGTVDYTGVTASFTPAADLATGTTYTATLTTGIKDLAGIALEYNYTWSFTTGGTADVTPPKVVTTTPATDAIDVAVNAAISAEFSEALIPATVSTATFTLSTSPMSGGGGNGGGGSMGSRNTVTGTVTFNGVTAIFTPAADLAEITVYTAKLTTGITDLAGNALATSYSWSFTTASETLPDLTPPTVVSTDPVDLAPAVLLTATVNATFDETLLAGTVTNTTFFLASAAGLVPGTVAYAGLTATFTPDVALDPSTDYTATLTPAIQDLAENALVGNTVVGDYVWTFTTEPPPAPVGDVTPPTVLGTAPLGVGVALNTAIAAEFSEALDPASVTTDTFQLFVEDLFNPGFPLDPTAPIAGAVTISENGLAVVFTPDAILPGKTPYVAILRTGITDLAGIGLAVDYNWSFVTGILFDGVAPTVLSTIPDNLDVNVVINPVITATFDGIINPATVSSTSLTLIEFATGAPVAGVVSATGATISFVPNTDLLLDTVYIATVTAGIADLAGNLLVADNVWGFSTGAVLAIVAVSGSSPSNGATNVSTATDISITFNEVLNPTSVSSASITVTAITGSRSGGSHGGSGTIVPSTFTANGSTAIVSPSFDLPPNTVVVVSINSNLTSSNGTPLNNDTSFSFTTGSGP